MSDLVSSSKAERPLGNDTELLFRESSLPAKDQVALVQEIKERISKVQNNSENSSSQLFLTLSRKQYEGAANAPFKISTSKPEAESDDITIGPLKTSEAASLIYIYQEGLMLAGYKGDLAQSVFVNRELGYSPLDNYLPKDIGEGFKLYINNVQSSLDSNNFSYPYEGPTRLAESATSKPSEEDFQKNQEQMGVLVGLHHAESLMRELVKFDWTNG